MPEIPSFLHLYTGPLVLPTNRDRFMACSSVRPPVCPSVCMERFPSICRRTYGGIGVEFCMLVNLQNFQNWLGQGIGLLIFLILSLFWLSGTGQSSGFRPFPGERMEVMAWKSACCCILVTYRLDYSNCLVISIILALFWLRERVKFGVSRHFLGDAWRV